MDMDSQAIDAKFNKAVEIVHGFRKDQQIQVDYEQKLRLYSYYKQATIGNVNSPRPSFFNMMERAKWDAWGAHKDMDSSEAKKCYVVTLLKILGKADESVARDPIQKLVSCGVPQDSASHHTLVRSMSTSSNSSGSTASNESPLLTPGALPQEAELRGGMQHIGDDADESLGEDDTGEELQELDRPFSSMSQYRTPRSTLALSPPLGRTSVPAMQPLPQYETQSAFQGPRSSSVASSSLHPSSASVPSHPHDLSPHPHSAPPHYGGHLSPPLPRHYSTIAQPRPPSRTRMPVEMAVENVQAHIAALIERMDSLEASINVQPQRSVVSMPLTSSGRGSPMRNQLDRFEWDIDDMGLWSYVLHPLSRGVGPLKRFTIFLLRSDHQSLVLMIVRRLCLDISFTLLVLALLRAVWKKSQARRREINAALRILWAALTGNHNNRRLISRAI